MKKSANVTSAEECAGQARVIQDEKLRADYLWLAQDWLKLARSYEVWQRLKRFTNEARRPRKAVRKDGDLHVFDFPCRRILGGRIKAATRESICVNPTHWRQNVVASVDASCFRGKSDMAIGTAEKGIIERLNFDHGPWATPLPLVWPHRRQCSTDPCAGLKYG
jgi:hypothetical protein